MRELVIDSFAGGGGASVGIEMAIERPVDIAINHDPAAIAMHMVNHTSTKHYCEDVWQVDPLEATGRRPVALAWFSPDCKHFSKAKGATPVEKKIRGLAWVVLKWAAKVRPRVIMLENVEEFKTWGPVRKGRPIKSKKGKTFELWRSQLESLGYEIESRELKACDYGAPTTRNRLFIIARCDGGPIVWPEPTHGDPEQLEVRCGLLKPWRTAAEIIDWSLPCPSIFDRKKPLAENTMKRIARGIKKFVFENPQPFIVRIGQTGYGGDRLQYSIEQPLTTITTKAEHCLVTPTLIQMGYGERKGQAPRVLDLHKPLGTITAGGNKFGLVAAFLAKHYGGNYQGAGAGLESPLPTITTKDHNALITAFISRQFKSSTGHKMDEPLGTITTVDKSRLVTAFLLKYYGSDVGQSLNEPLHTITTKDRFGIVTIHGEDYQIIDIGMRMLQPHELYPAQGFPVDYIIDRDINGKKFTIADQVKMCGNSVTPVIPEALVKANLPELCHGEVEEVM